MNIAALNPMQQKAIDTIYTNRNTLLHAPTGSGKTLAYLIPVTKMVMQTKKTVQALIIVPTRELALQIASVHKSMGTPVTMACCYGGHAIEVEKESLAKIPAIIVGTPGRLAAHLKSARFSVDHITTLVLDEFDKCLEFGFLDEMEGIIKRLTKLKKRICISATRLHHIPDFLKMDTPCTIDYSDESLQPRITFKSVESPTADKLETLLQLIKYLGSAPALIFCNHRDAVERVTKYLVSQKLNVLMYHGGMEQPKRETSLLKFRNGSYHLLVTTDLASRGLDIPEIEYIIHYHLPSTEAAFIHRNGRTARMQATGTSFIIFSENEKVPAYLPKKPETEYITPDLPLPDPTEWVTLEINVGKRDKISKGDIVGYLIQKGHLQNNELGLVEVTDRETFAAVKRSKAKRLIALVASEPLKRKKVAVTFG